jgi:hypothetical protein
LHYRITAFHDLEKVRKEEAYFKVLYRQPDNNVRVDRRIILNGLEGVILLAQDTHHRRVRVKSMTLQVP